MRISFLIQNFYGVGGTNTAVHNLAVALSAEHDVEVVSVFRRQDDCPQPVEGRYTVTSLVDVRTGQPDATDPRRYEPSALVPAAEEMYSQYSRLTDERLTRFLRSTRSDVVIGTRPGLNIVLASHGSDHYLRISQEHMTQDLIHPEVRDAMVRTYSALDVCVCLTVADAQALGEELSDVAGPEVLAIPNAVPGPEVEVSDCSSHVVVAAGRLAEVKQYDILISAFAIVAPEHPTWHLRLYGAGPERPVLRRLVQRLGLDEQVLLMGRAVPLGPEWVKGSMLVSTSAHESFGMTIVEAMRHGLPVISTDCPVGPSEIIRDGHDGRLVEVGDVVAVAGAMRRLMDDDDLRRSMGAAARDTSARFDPASVQATYVELFTTLAAQRRVSARSRLTGRLRKGRGTLADAGTSARQLLSGITGPKGVSEVAAEESAASVVVGHDGALVVRLPIPSASPSPAKPADPMTPAAPPPTTQTTLVATLRGDAAGTEVTAPFVRSAEGLYTEATLAPTAFGDEGRWNLQVQRSGHLSRLRPGPLDTRVLAGARAASSTDAGSTDAEMAPVALPYATRDGYLAVRTWVRPRHAECTALTLVDDRLEIHVAARGFPLGPDACLEVHRRGPRPSVSSTAIGSDDSRHGSAQVDLRLLVQHRLTRHDDWDVWVRPGPDQDLLRVARILDDVVDRKGVYVQPLLTFASDDELPWVEEEPVSTVRVRPYFAADSGLSLYVAD